MTDRVEIWGILGSGFGLYGYLPAVATRTRGTIHTPAHYRETIRGRGDIRGYEDRIIFEKDAKAVLDRCNAVIVALRPADQELVLAEMLDRKWQGKVVLEKPLARTPEAALALLERLAAGGIDFRISFTLGVTDWAEMLAQHLAANRGKEISLEFQWRFLAHHYRTRLETWKRHCAQGGGATRFYAIHLIALFAKWGFDRPLYFRRSVTGLDEEPECRFAVSDDTSRAAVVCDTNWRGKPCFSIHAKVEGSTLFWIELDDPFKEGPPSRPDDVVDGRVGYLRKILGSFDAGASPEESYYVKHVRLWSELEKMAATGPSE